MTAFPVDRPFKPPGWSVNFPCERTCRVDGVGPAVPHAEPRHSYDRFVDGHVIPQGWRHAMPHGVRVQKLLRGGLLGLG
jgi:hypothetical protein